MKPRRIPVRVGVTMPLACRRPWSTEGTGVSHHRSWTNSRRKNAQFHEPPRGRASEPARAAAYERGTSSNIHSKLPSSAPQTAVSAPRSLIVQAYASSGFHLPAPLQDIGEAWRSQANGSGAAVERPGAWV